MTCLTVYLDPLVVVVYVAVLIYIIESDIRVFYSTVCVGDDTPLRIEHTHTCEHIDEKRSDGRTSYSVANKKREKSALFYVGVNFHSVVVSDEKLIEQYCVVLTNTRKNREKIQKIK